MRWIHLRTALVAGIGTATAAFVLIGGPAGSAVHAAQELAQTQSAAPDASDQTVPAPKPHHKGSKLTAPINPDLDTTDQLAPSQMRQQVPAAVSQPMSAPVKPTRPAVPVTAAAASVGTGSKADAALAKGHMVACSGVFSKDSSHLRLAMTFDSRNVTFTDVDGDNGAKVPASVLFPNDPKRRLEVWWSNPAARNQTYLIVINGKSTWIAPGGMKLGLTLAQLEKLNHKPFKVKGFDKGGTAIVSDWDGGALATLAGGCKSGMSLKADPKAAADTVAALSADKEYSSADPELRAAKPIVSEILIGY
ncbi:MAG TPA: hypothetical protein VMA30_01645 [Xanthobacteraceae bacterium]|nr:hypothetical protein [Xanthobacteraceae bacterium]